MLKTLVYEWALLREHIKRFRHRRRVGSGLPKGGLNPPAAGSGLGIPPFNPPENPAGLIPGTQWVGLNELYPFGSGSGLEYIYRLSHLS